MTFSLTWKIVQFFRCAGRNQIEKQFHLWPTNVSETCHASRPFPAPLICVRNQIARFEHKVWQQRAEKKEAAKRE